MMNRKRKSAKQTSCAQHVEMRKEFHAAHRTHRYDWDEIKRKEKEISQKLGFSIRMSRPGDSGEAYKVWE